MTLIEFGHDLFRVVFFLWRLCGAHRAVV